MRAFNLRLQEGHESEAVVARDALRSLGLSRQEAGAARREIQGHRARRLLLEPALGARPADSPASRPLGRRPWRWGRSSRFPWDCGWSGGGRWAETVIRILGIFQTVPSLALLAFMIPFLGVGAVPAIVALWIYSLFPIVRNT